MMRDRCVCAAFEIVKLEAPAPKGSLAEADSQRPGINVLMFTGRASARLMTRSCANENI